MKRFFYLLLLVSVLIAACTGGEHRRALDTAYALINERPDSAIAILDSLGPSAQDLSRGQLRRWQLLRLMAQNKCDTVFRSDSLQRILTDYYDRHGTPNERMWAHYLLGRAYYDMGEALPALKAYEDATAAADTTAADCDFWNLCRVYIQQSILLYYQNLPNEILKTLENAKMAAQKAGDTIGIVYCYEKRALAYERLEKRDSMALAGTVASAMYHDIGQDQMAARALAWVIPYNIENGDLNLARKNMQTYEKLSGFFDEKNIINPGMEHYYATKANYYLAAGQNDSAEYYYRKCSISSLMPRNNDIARNDINCKHASYRGLAALYSKINKNDSAAKYASLSEMYNDSMHARSYMTDALNMSKMYDYSKNMDKTKKEKQKLENARTMLIISLILSYIFFGVIISYIWTRLKKHKNAYFNDEEVKEQDAEDRESAPEKHINVEQEESTKERLEQIDIQLKTSDTYQKLTRMTKDVKETVSPELWKQLDDLFIEYHKEFHTFVHSIENVTDNEIIVCELIRLGFNPSLIAVIMNCSNPYIATLRANLHYKIFGKKGKPKEVDKYLLSM